LGADCGPGTSRNDPKKCDGTASSSFCRTEQALRPAFLGLSSRLKKSCNVLYILCGDAHRWHSCAGMDLLRIYDIVWRVL
jgi:hypothetical protein